jgi:esterase/lipase
MHRMYMGVTVNLSHLASSIFVHLVERHATAIEHDRFHRQLYLAVKRVQGEPHVHLHRSLRDPGAYGGLMDGGCVGLEQFLRTASRSDLIEQVDGEYRFSPKLREEHEFDDIRLENLIEVYANEAAPLTAVPRAVRDAVAEADTVSQRRLAELRFDDERIAHLWDRRRFSKPRHREINDGETATESGEPFLLLPEGESPLGVVLVHGFLASPAELRGLGEKLHALGYPVLGVRVKGHGTSPWDLRERSWQDWLDSVRRGFAIMSALAPRVALVGFSTGGALSLVLAGERPPELAGVVAASVPQKFGDRNMRFVPLVHGANRLLRWVSSFEGIMPFRANDSEHPSINYRQMPIRGLYELTVLADGLPAHLKRVTCPVTLLQGDTDPVVVPDSVRVLHEMLEQSQVEVTIIASDRHGIVNEDVGDTHATILRSLAQWRGKG